ncbi:MAG: hypothetical protein OEV81_17135, partial [Betaproteobacteria bacterium]|nr:hypothetical protein [Betaproteobacteria bacterium]
MRRILYAALRATSALDQWLRERLTAAGWLALGAGGAALAAGFDTTQNASYQAGALLVALLVVAYAASLFARTRLHVARELPRYATAGEPFSYPVEVVNRGARPVAGASVVEAVRDPRPAYAAWRAAREPGEEQRNWFDRNVGYFRWRWLIERVTPEPLRAAPLPALVPGARHTLRMQMTPRR